MRGKVLSRININKIIDLRTQGKSIVEISNILLIPKTTVYFYSKKVKISDNVARILHSRRGGSAKRKTIKEKMAKKEAEEMLRALSKKEKILFLSALYWAEGTKKDFGLSNTDPNLIRVYVSILREIFKIPNERFRVSIRIHEDLDRDACLQFWSEIVKIPKEDFIGVEVLEGKRKGKLSYGMCRIRVTKGEELLKKIVAVYSTVGNILSL